MSYLPPRLETFGELKEYSSGGDNNWLTFEKTKLYTNAYVISGAKVASQAYSLANGILKTS